MFGGLFLAFFRGVVDSVRGVVAIFYLDRLPASAQQQQIYSINSDRPLTTLAQRRLEQRAKKENSSSATSAKKPTTDERPKAWRRLISCVLLNLFCIGALHYCFMPIIESGARLIFGQRRVAVIASILNALWVLPVFFITRLVNALWFQDIANAAVRYRAFHSDRGIQSQSTQSFSRNVADFILAIFLETIFLLQAYFVGLLPLPIINVFVSYLHLCLLYSLYSFEYLWMSEGVELKERLKRIEMKWPYFFGFGCLLAAVTSYPSSVVLSGCMFGIFFPVLIISSFEAKYLDVENHEDDWQRVNFFDPSIYICDKLSLNLINRATARTFIKRQRQ